MKLKYNASSISSWDLLRYNFVPKFGPNDRIDDGKIVNINIHVSGLLTWSEVLLHAGLVGRARSYTYLHFVHGSGLIYWPSAGRGLKLVRCHMSRDILFCFSRTERLPAYFAQNLHSGARHELFINAPYLEEFLHAQFYRRFAPRIGNVSVYKMFWET